MNLVREKEDILSQKATPVQKAHMFIQRAAELQLDGRQWQSWVWLLPDDILNAIGWIKQQQGVHRLSWHHTQQQSHVATPACTSGIPSDNNKQEHSPHNTLFSCYLIACLGSVLQC